MPLPLRYQWQISNSNVTYEYWLEQQLYKRLVSEEAKILQSAPPCNSDYAAALFEKLRQVCPATECVLDNEVVVSEERLNFAIKALQNCA